MTHPHPPSTLALDPVRIDDTRRALSRAFARVAPLWPLDRMVAVNPYFGLREHTFTESTDLLRRVAGARATMDAEYYLDALASGRITTEDVEDVLRDAGDARCVHTFVDALGRGSASAVAVVPTVATVADVATRVTPRDWVRFITERVSQWASAYFDDGQARWRAPSSDREGLFAAWREEALIDRTPEIEGLAHFRRIVASLPRAPEKAAAVALDRLAVPPEARDDYLHRLFMRVAGWAAHCARIAFERDLHEGAADHAGIELGTVMLVWEVALLEATGDDVARVWSSARGRSSRAARGDDMAPDLELMQAAFERAYQRRLQRAFPPQRPPTSRTRPAAQAVFCIDVRSEVFRRHLEAVAPEVETSGFAGFFGFPIAVEPIAHARPVHQCPVLLSPSHRVPERRATDVATERATTTRTLRGAVEDAWTRFKMGAVSCFSFVGPVGLAYLPKLVSDGLGWTRPVPHPREEAHHHDHPDPAPLPLEERVDLAAGALRGMSLHRDVPLARLVVITGHGSTSVNNPHASALDCGACGGRSGAPNARFAAAVLNDPEVRAGLDARGVTVPEDTIFVAALHDTTRDEVTVLSDVPASHAQDLVRLQEQLAAAGARSRVERAPRMGIAPEAADEAIDARSRDWAQTRPEWGLAGCAAFIAAPRHRTRGRDLGGRSFLHDYTWQTDDDFETLELIMTAPVVVASWISLQYYASTVAPELFGAGDKTLHNVVGAIGVLEGTGGDLRTGLPLQSVHDGARWQHEPLRLHVAIEAPCAAINAVIERHEVVRQLVDHGWIHLFAIDEAGRLALRYAGQARWEATDPGAPPMAASPMAAEWHERRESPSSGGLRRRA